MPEDSQHQQTNVIKYVHMRAFATKKTPHRVILVRKIRFKPVVMLTNHVITVRTGICTDLPDGARKRNILYMRTRDFWVRLRFISNINVDLTIERDSLLVVRLRADFPIIRLFLFPE